MFTTLRSLALLLFIAAPMAMPVQAKACGGYGAPISAEYQVISQVLYHHFEQNRSGVQLAQVVPSSITGITALSSEASPMVVFTRGEFRYQQELRVRRTRSGWQVVGGQMPVRV